MVLAEKPQNLAKSQKPEWWRHKFSVLKFSNRSLNEQDVSSSNWEILMKPLQLLDNCVVLGPQFEKLSDSFILQKMFLKWGINCLNSTSAQVWYSWYDRNGNFGYFNASYSWSKRAVQEFTGVNYTATAQHKDTFASRIKRDMNDTKKTLGFLDERYPFSEDPSIRCIATGVTADEWTNSDIWWQMSEINWERNSNQHGR